MKIIAQIPQGTYHDPHFVVELSTVELDALLALSHYEEIEVISPSGVKTNKQPKDLCPGDIIDPAVAATAINAIRSVRDAKYEITKASAAVKGALTKLTNNLP